MRPADYPIQYQQIYALWESFMQVGQLPEPPSAYLLDPIVLLSWQRCYPHHKSHVAPQTSYIRNDILHTLLQRQKEWMTVAVPYLEEILQCMTGADHALILTDRTGCVLYLAGDNRTKLAIEQAELGIGAYWSEETIATNAIGLSLITVMPTQVTGPEHFYQAFHGWSTTAAPIHHVDGQIIGAVGIISPTNSATRRDIALTMSMALAINGLLQTERYLEEVNRQLTQVNMILEMIDEGILIWDAHNRIVYCNMASATVLGLAVAALRGKYVDHVIKWPVEIQDALTRNLDIEERKVRLYAQNRPVHCLLSIRTMQIKRPRSGAADTVYVAQLALPQAEVHSSQPNSLLENPKEIEEKVTFENAEREAILRAGRKHHGVVTKMANELSIGRTTLWRKMREFHITPSQLKKESGAPASGKNVSK